MQAPEITSRPQELHPPPGHETLPPPAANGVEPTVSLPAPLVPKYVNLRRFEKMPLAVQRLRDSSLASTPNPEAFRCAILLFCSSWHQVPAGSLPGDERELAKLAGFGRNFRTFLKVSSETLRGWVKCSDGRFYHPVVAAEALNAWTAHLRQGWKTECARLKKVSQRNNLLAHFPSFPDWVSRYQDTGNTTWDELCVPRDVPGTSPGTNALVPRDVPGEMASKGREGKGINKSSSIETPKRADRSQSEAMALARALAGMGYEGCSAKAPEVVEAVRAGVNVDELRSAAVGMKPGKPLAWLIARVLGKRKDAADLVAGSEAPARVASDPEALARQAEERALEDARYQVENDFRLGLISAAAKVARLQELAKGGVS